MTIALAEHYATDCGGGSFYWGLAYQGIGNLLHRATFADTMDVRPVTGGPPPFTSANLPGRTFQVKPSPQLCDSAMPQTPHPGGMLVAMVDGSVRVIAPAVSEPTFWAAVTPNSGEVLGFDW